MREMTGTIDTSSFTDLDNNGLYLGIERFVVTVKETDCCQLELDLSLTGVRVNFTAAEIYQSV